MKSMVLKKILSVLLLVTMMLNAVAVVPFSVFAEDSITANKPTSSPNKGNPSTSVEHAYEPFQSIKEYQYSEHADQVDETTILLKLAAGAPALSPVPEELAKLGVTLLRTVVDVTTPEAMEKVGSQIPYRWVVAGLKDVKATEIGLSFANVPYVLDAEYNYIRQTTALPDQTTNPLVAQQWYLNEDITSAWDHLDTYGWRENLQNIVVAVIDTGVDYEHGNLRDSLWVNTGEIPNNDIDDDNNGYIDDVHGVSTIGSVFDATGDPMDNMGHGTHVAGIIAATPDKMGMVGLAHGVQIMAIKAGDGYFNDSDIIEGINYAVEMGADVINMSFGSYARSAMMEEALAIAYSSAVLVAAAGNDSTDTFMAPCYPAAYNFVIGVMAEDESGNVASFSNTDSVRRNSVEYEVSAPGSRIFSTLPDDRYASWSGTSMAAPYVSAVAALLRAKYNDKSEFSTRFIMGQIVGTADMAQMGLFGSFPISVDPLTAMTEIPEPDVSYYDFFIFDDPAYSEKNNGDGVIDAGETIGLGVQLRNHWGQARKTKVQLVAAMNSGDASTNPYVTWITDTVEYGDIGTFVTANNGFVYDAEGVITGIENPFMFTVADNAPNDAYLTFSVVIDCESYTELDETLTYHFEGDSFSAQVRRGVELPRKIVQDTVLKSDTYYIISGSTLIDQGVTVTVEPGTQIQFWGDYSKELYAGTDIAQLIVDGELIVKGTEDAPVDIFTSGSMYGMEIRMEARNRGKISLEYCNVANPNLQVTTIDHCYFTQMIFDAMYSLHKSSDGSWISYYERPRITATSITNSIFYEMGYYLYGSDYRLEVNAQTLKGNLFDSCGLNFYDSNFNAYSDNVFLKNNRLVESQYGDTTYLMSQFSISSPFTRTNCLTPFAPVKNPETGSTYFVLTTNSLVLAEEFAETLGGHIAYLDDEAERDFVLEYIERYYVMNEDTEDKLGRSLWQFYIGFYRNASGLTYVGRHPETTWLEVKKDTAIPVISTSYWTDGNGDVVREAYLSTTHVWSSEYTNLTSRNPSNSRHTSTGVIIEIPGDISPISVAFDSDALTLPSNTESYQLGTSLFPHVEGTELTWASSDEAIVTVDETGKITAHDLGVAKVTVTIAGTSISAETTIVIVEYHEPTGIEAEKTEIAFTKYQDTYQLAPTVTPAEASPILDFSSSDTSVAIVSTTGLVTALSNGKATITVSVRGTELTLDYNVTVAIPPSSISLARDYIILGLDDTAKTSLSYTFAPAYATVQNPTYISSDPSVVTVDENGVLTPVSTGNAIILVYFADVDMAVKARVYVAASRSEIQIINAEEISQNTNGTVLYAEDGTTYLLTNENMGGDPKFPQKLPVKTLKFAMRWSNEIAFIDPDHTLYYGSMNNYRKVDEDVADVVFASNYNNFFYLKENGTVWYYPVYNQQQPIQVDLLQDIVDIQASHNMYLFLDSSGSAWYAKFPESDNSTSFNTEIVVVDGTVAKISPNFLYTTEGGAYSISWSNEGPTLNQIENLSADMLEAALNVAWSDIADISYDRDPNRFWLLLNDGRVIFSGYYGSNSTYDKNISSLIDCSANGSWGYSFVNLPQKVVAIGNGAFVLEDGSTLMVGTRWDSVLGNGKSYDGQNRYLTYPVSPWIGAQNDKQKITWTSLTVSTSNGDVTLPYTDTHLDVDVGINVKLSFALSKLVETDQLANAKIYFQDAFGQKISAVARLDALGQTLIVTAVEPLKEGYEYVLTIGGYLTDAYGNTNETIRLTFSAEGTAIYEVPVEGIEYGDTESAFQLKYGDTKQLSVTVLPENASMKRIYWTTSDARVATVTSAGLVTGRHNGVATIYATAADGNFQLEFTVTVSTPPDSVVLQSEFMYMEKGETGRYMTLTVTPSYADLGELTYISLDPSIATVDENGCVTAVSVGKTAVAIRSSKTGQSYFAAVEVVEENASSKILYSDWNYLNYSNAFFIAEDHTLWLINSGNTYFDNQNGYIPQNTGVKAVDAEMLGSYLYYVTDDGELYRRYIYGTGHAPEKLGDKVDSIVGYDYNDHGLFCLMTDGSVRFWHNQLNKLQICSALSNVQDIHYFNSHYFFVKNDGTVKYIEYMSSYESYYSVVNNYRDLDLTEPLIDYVRGHDGFLAESKEIYRISSNDSGLSLYSEGLTSYDAYNAIKDRIVKLVHAKDDSWSRSYLALLDDGTVAYIGERSYIPNGLMALVTQDPASDSFVVCILPGISDVVDVTPGYMVLANGSVLAYAYNNRYTNLGNNNSANNRYPVPVTAWIGAVDNRTGISIQQAQAESSTGSVSANDMLYFEGKVKANTTISLTLSDVAFYLNTEAIFLQDDFGNIIPATCVVDTTGKVLVITPSEALKDGYDYVLIIPSQTFGNHFHYYNSETYYTLTVEGTAVYDVPVTSVEPDCETSFELEFGQTAQLSVAVSPENATVKSVRWSSSNRNVATVDEDGLVTAHYNGTAVITATTKDGEMTVTFTITVSTSPEKIYVPTEFFYMEIGETGRHLTVTATPSYADIGSLTFASLDPSIATIDENGCITAVAAGKTAVSVTLSKTGATYYATVVVAENDASAHIIQANYLARNSNVMFFIAEDHTLWMLSPGNTYFGSRNAYIPQNTGIKAVDVEMVNSYLFYVTESGELYRQYAYGTGNTPTKLGDKVASIEGYSSNGNGLFCLMTDGSVQFWRDNQMTVCSALSNVQEICYSDGRYFFIKNDGTVKYIQSTSDYESYYSIINNYKDVTFPEKIIGSVPGLYGFMGESKEYYYCGFDSDGNATAYTHSLTTHASYQAIADRVLKLVAAKRNDTWSNAYLALLDDGTVAFVGDYGYLPTGLRTLVTQNDPSDPFVTCILSGISDVVDVAPGYLVLSNGSVLAYAANGNNNYTILGNNNKDSSEYTVPVTAWFGAVDNGSGISIQQAQATGADGTVTADMLHFDALLKADTSFVLTLSDVAFSAITSGIFLQDEFGARITTVCTMDATGKVLTVTPTEALKDGYDYTLVIPSQTFRNNFRYYNDVTYYSFRVEGTPVYENPVTSVEPDCDTSYELEYGETAQLSVVVSPDNATVKTVYWTSSDENVATVNETGLVTARYNGTATITATTKDGGYTATFTVKVSTPPKKVYVQSEFFYMEKDETNRYLTLTSVPFYADLGKLTYASLDPSVAVIDENGCITAVAAGKTAVSVTSSMTGATYYATVEVVENDAPAHITQGILNQNDRAQSFFIAEDHSLWMIYAGSAYFGNQSYYIPQNTGVKAVDALIIDSYLYYVTEGGELYRLYIHGANNTPVKLGEQVSSIESYTWNNHGLFCLMTDGTVWFWHSGLEQMQPCSSLTNVQDILHFDYRYFFLKTDGSVLYIEETSKYESFYSVINHYESITFPEKITSSVPGSNCFMGESNELYYLSYNEDKIDVYSYDLNSRDAYTAISDRIVKMVISRPTDPSYLSLLALLDDGTVAYVGEYYYVPDGLQTLVTQNDTSDSFVACILPGIANVVDVTPGYMILSNGSVLAYAANGYNQYASLGNNNREGNQYTVPVTAWFGAVDSRTTISIQQAQANAADGTVSANVALHFDALLKTDTAFTLTLSEIAFYSNLSGIFLQDELGGRISTVCTLDATGRVLTITPAESLKEGYDYTLVIPARSYGNSFRYYNEAIYYSFTAEGTPTYDIPVESIEASGQTEYTLQYGETVLLSVLVGPHNASQKKVYWTSSDTNVATVDSNGRVTAYYNGTATITATTKDGRHSVTFTVTVSTTPTDVLILDELIIMEQGEEGRVVRLDVTPGYADLGVLTYESLDPTIATVDASTGAITAVAVGTTRVGVTSSKTGTTYYTEVQVKESTDSLRINALQTSHSGLALFTAEDGTVWYLSNYNSDQYLPRKTHFQAKAVYGWDYLYSRVYYITPDNALYYRDNVTSSYGYKVADRVVTAAANGSDVFYLTEDGRVYYYGSYGSYEFTSLNNVVDIAHLSCGVFVFTDNAGKVFYLYTNELDSYKTADLIFQELDCYEKVISILPHSSMLITESGLIYRFNSSSYSTDTVLADLADYQAIREDVVSVVNASYTNHHYYAFIAQLADGSYYYVGSGPDAPRGLRHLIKDYEINKNVYDYMVLPMQGMDGVAQIVNGYFLMEDGSVRAYNQYASTGYNSFRYMLGNNNVQSIDYLSPVTVWFGVENDGLSMNVTGIHAVNGTDSIDLYSNGFVYTLPMDFHLEITANKYIHKIHTDYVALTDVSGNRIDLEFSFVGKTLIVTVKNPEDIQAGMIYRLKLPSSAMQDLFSNGSAYFEIRFATDGEMAFEVPVTGITDTVSEISLKYNESYRFVPTVAPEDATVKDLFWHSDNPAVATVSETGVVTAGKNGTAIITATTLDGRFAYQYTVTVKTPVESFSISSEFVLLDMSLKTSYQLDCTITPAILAGDSSLFIWSSADDSIATVDETGTVTAVSAGVTAIYCTSKDSNVTATCIVSVLSDRKIATVDRVFADAATQGVAMMAGDNLWVVNPSNIYPKLLANVSEALEVGETITKILPVSSNNSILLVLTQKTEGEGDTQTTVGRLKTLSLSDGTFTNVSIGRTNDEEQFVEENILDVIVRNSYVWVLTQNGTVWWKDYNYSSNAFRQYAQLEGITQIAMSKPDNYVYMLTTKGTVCYVSASSGSGSWNSASLDEGVKITQLGLADGFLMMDETGRYYPMTTNSYIRQAVERLYGTYDFNKIKEQVVDVAVHQEYSGYTPQFVFLLSDGSLVSMGDYYSASPLYTSYSGYAWNQSPDNSYLYYIDTMTEAQVVDVGHNYILFDDGSLYLFASGAYLGNFEHTSYHTLVSPHFAQTSQDLSKVALSDIYFGETSANRDESDNLLLEVIGPAADTVELVFTTPLLFNERLTNTVIKYQGADSTEYVNCSVTVDRHRIVITPAEALQPGVTYTVTIPDSSIYDVFNHGYGSMITFTVTVTESTEDTGAAGGSETMSTRYDDSLYPTTEYSPDLALKDLQTAARDFYAKALTSYIMETSLNVNNAFLNGFANPDTTYWMDIRAQYDSSGNAIGSLIGNYWGTTKVDLIDRLIYDMKDSFDYAEILYEPFLTVAPETAYPFVTSIIVKNSDGNVVSSVGLEDITVYVYFNRDMDIAVQPTVSHGSAHPFTDFMISGDWIDARTWVGTTRITAVTGSGTQYFRVSGAVAADDGWLKTGTDAERFAFTIATSGAKSMSLQANSGNGYIELEWSQDDFDTLAGYNIYRSTNADDPSSFVKINSSIILAGSDRNVYVDRDVDSGVEYFYRFTVVKTDFTESEPSGSTSAASYDTTPPTINHSVVGSTAESAGVPIIAYVHDNMHMVASVKLFYRIKGETEFKMLEMYAHTGNHELNNQNKYSANIPAGDVTAAGLEYYIEASDGRQSSFVGTDQSPYTINTYKLYTVTVMTTSGGKINVSALRVRAGEWVDVSTTADEGYAYLAGSLVYTDGTTETVIDGSFLMPEANITIKATFLEKSEHTMGDLNLDGKVDSADAILLLRYDAGLMQLDNEQLILADVTGDGRINVSDAREILRLDAGL